MQSSDRRRFLRFLNAAKKKKNREEEKKRKKASFPPLDFQKSDELSPGEGAKEAFRAARGDYSQRYGSFKRGRSCERPLTFFFPPPHAVGGKFTATTSSAETSGEGRLLTRWRRIEAEEGDYCACYCLFKGALRQMLSPHCALSAQSRSSA